MAADLADDEFVGDTMSDKICPNCNKPLDEHYVAKSATLNRPHVYICPTNVCPVDGLFEEVPAAPAQPAGELRDSLEEFRTWFDSVERQIVTDPLTSQRSIAEMAWLAALQRERK